MRNQEQVYRIIRVYENLKKENRGYDILSKYPYLNLIYCLYLSGKDTQHKVSLILYKIKQKPVKDKRKKPVLPIVNYYTQALEKIGWVNKIKKDNLVIRGESKYILPGTRYYANLNPLFEYFESKKYDNILTKRGKSFLESFFNNKRIKILAISENQTIISSGVNLLRNYILFKHYLELLQKIHKKLDLDIVLKKYSSKKINLPLGDDLYLEFFGIYIRERKFWINVNKDNNEVFLKEEYENWWNNFEDNIFEGYADTKKLQIIIKNLLKKQKRTKKK